jgi:glutamate dehydrogenase (NAD(P)+)
MSDERRLSDRALLTQGPEPELVMHWHDPVTGAPGYVIIDALSQGVSFGGVRVRRNQQWTDLASLARIGTIRYQLARVPIGGARLGLNYDPEAPDVDEVVGRFLSALRPLMSTVLSVGPDLHLNAPKLDQIIEKNGLPWRMEAVRRSQGWTMDRWHHYNQVLDEVDAEGHTLRDMQVALSAAHATLEMGEYLFHRAQTVAVLGAGPFGTTIARLAAKMGATVVGVGSASAGVYAAGGLNPAVLEAGARVSLSLDPSHMFITLDEFYSLPVDAIILASNDAVTIDNVGRIRANLVVEAAARSVTPLAEKVLVARGTPVLPSFAVTTGAILAADALFRGEVTTAEDTRTYIGKNVRTTVKDLARLSTTLRISVRDAGVRVAFHRHDISDIGPVEPTLYSVVEEPPEFM